MSEKLSLIKAAQLMGASPMNLRKAIKQGKIPFAYSYRSDHRTEYYISKRKFIEWTGIEPEKAETTK